MQHKRYSLVAAGEAAKIPLCLLITASTFFGYKLAGGAGGMTGWTVSGAILLLAMGLATFNSLQEQELDGSLLRTRNRPLVSGRLTRLQALLQAVVLSALGLTLLAITVRSRAAVFCALLAIVLYNGVYTPLKQRSILAIIPGAVSGALPPCIGWFAGGGQLYDYGFVLLFVLLVLWQIPHTLLILLNHKEDYLQSHLPHLLKVLSEKGICRLFVTWVGALALVMIMFVVQKQVSLLFAAMIVINAVALPAVFARLLFKETADNRYRRLFFYLNMALLAHMVLTVFASSSVQ